MSAAALDDAGSKLRNTLRGLALALPLPTGTKVRLYYRIFTPFFLVLGEGTGMLNYGQEALCARTAASLPRPGRWLDVGCGVGGPACWLARENPEVRVTGLNIAPRQIEVARRRAGTAGLTARVEFVHGDACRMPFDGDGLFDGLYAIETAFHFPDKPAFVREARRVLRPGGRFACADMVLAERPAGLGQRLATWGFNRWLGIMRMVTASAWRSMLEAGGFRDVAIEDVTDLALRDGLALANARIEKHRALLERHYPRALVDAVVKGNERVVRDVEAQPMRYVLATATA